jgi:hypothetical protein
VININGKVACESKAVYGKKGDAVSISSRLDKVLTP